jgi:hypothetical protein
MTMIIRWIGVFLVLCILPLPVQAVLLYDTATLRSWAKGRPEGNQGTREDAAQANLNDFIMKKLTPIEYDLVRGVQLKFPLYHEDPLDCRALPSERTAVDPIAWTA